MLRVSTSLKGNVAITDLTPYQKFVEGQALRRLVQELVGGGSQAAIELRTPQYGTSRENLIKALGEQDGWDVVRFSGHGRPGKIAFDIQVC
jgi:hypothetical protein